MTTANIEVARLAEEHAVCEFGRMNTNLNQLECEQITDQTCASSKEARNVEQDVHKHTATILTKQKRVVPTGTTNCSIPSKRPWKASAVITTPQITAMFANRPHSHQPIPRQRLADPVLLFAIDVINSLNSTDNLRLAQLLRANLSQQCFLGIYCLNAGLGMSTFLKYWELMNEIHVDRVFSIKGTSVGNGIVTVATEFKFTDCKVLHDSISKPVNDPELMSFLVTRSNQLKRRIRIPDQSMEERRKIVQMVDTNCDLVVCGRLQFNVKYDEESHKVNGFYLTGGLTSVHPVPASLFLDQ